MMIISLIVVFRYLFRYPEIFLKDFYKSFFRNICYNKIKYIRRCIMSKDKTKKVKTYKIKSSNNRGKKLL